MDSAAKKSDHELIDAARKTAGQFASLLGSATPATELFPGYDVVRQIGRGGQGVVYEAVQRATKRHVAIKAIRGGAFVTPHERIRFRREVEFAARLQHPNIVSVLDSGIHQGNDFFVMEYVQGSRIDQIETPGAGPVRDTLGRLAAICDVVDYAHQRGVLHRDLKPSNVIIDERGQPHILDFGLAKEMDHTGGSSAGMTISEPGQILGTLGYMSPEQSRGLFDQMSIRSDVYSLGAMGYQLLTGALPCRLDGGLEDVLMRISHQDPARPSSIRRQLDADVDAILLKALEKSPTNRYSTAGDLAADIRRFLADEPIHARRIGMPTRIARWTRRHRAISTVSVVALTVTVTIGVISVVQLRAQANQSKLVSDFLKATIALFDPEKGGTPKEVLKGALDARAKMVSAALSGNPAAEAEVRNTLGELYTKISCYKEAEAQFRPALDIRLKLYGEESLEVAETQRNLGFSLKQMNQIAEAEPLYRKELATLRALLKPDDDRIAYDLTYLGGLLRAKGEYDEAARVFNESLEIRRRRLPEDSREIAIVKNMLALIFLDTGSHASAERLFRDVLVVYRRDLSATEPIRVATCLNNLAECLRVTGQLAEAETLCREGLEIRQKLFPADNLDVAGSQLILGRILMQEGDLLSAQGNLTNCLKTQENKLPPGHPTTAITLSVLGECLTRQSKFAEAEPLLLKGHQSLSSARGPNFAGTTEALQRITDLYTAWGQPEKATEYLTRANKSGQEK